MADNVVPHITPTHVNETSPQPRTEVIRQGSWLQLFSPKNFEWIRLNLPIANLSPKLEGFRIIHLTDLHLKSRWWPAYDELHRLVNANPPDIVFITGDFVDHKWRRKKTLPILQRFVDGLNAKLGVWGILGNHDGDLLLPHLVNFKLHLLHRARTILEARDDAIELIGIPSVQRGDLDEEFLRTIPPRENGRLRIVLQHFPDDIRTTKSLQGDIVLAGHTHGGQICLPGRKPIITHDSLPKDMSSGVHRVDQSWLIVGRGFGFASLPVRAFCPAEVVEITLTRWQGEGVTR
jgi:predicted MPP superfamily phosphohydrolase